jgi:hypothetical protein
MKNSLLIAAICALAWSTAGGAALPPGGFKLPPSTPILHSPPNYVPPVVPPYATNPLDVPYVRSSSTLGAFDPSGMQTQTISIFGSVAAGVADPSGFFGGSFSSGQPFSSTSSLQKPGAPASYQDELVACAGAAGGQWTSPCDCGCYYGPGYEAYSTFGTYDPQTNAALCSASSSAVVRGKPQGGVLPSCNDTAFLADFTLITTTQTAPMSFTLTLPDGTTLFADPNAPITFFTRSSNSQFLTAAAMGKTAPLLFPTNVSGFNVPAGGLACTAGTSSICSHVDELAIVFDLSDSAIQLVYWTAGNHSQEPDGVLPLSVEHTGTPGSSPVAHGEALVNALKWWGAWDPTQFYNTNDVVTFKGATYVATNATAQTPPDVDPLEWTMVGVTTSFVSSNMADFSLGGSGSGGAGAPGQVGPPGPIGPAGATGATGATGQTGPQGPAGPVGHTGADGLSTQIVGTADQIACPTGGVLLATLTSAGVPVGNTEPVCNGLKGDAGPVGPQGPTGAQGPQGLTGTPGIDGLPSGTVLYVLQGSPMPSGWTALGAVHEVAVKTGSSATSFYVVVWVKN